MGKVLIDKIKSQDICKVTDTPVNNTAEEFIVSYYNSILEFIVKENNINDYNLCKSIDDYSIRTKRFLDWFREEGTVLLCDILEALDENKLNENATSFSKLYNYLLNKSISNNNMDALIDYLYLIPGVMRREYEKFGYIQNVLNIIKSIPFHESHSKISDYILNISNFERSENQISCFI